MVDKSDWGCRLAVLAPLREQAHQALDQLGLWGPLAVAHRQADGMTLTDWSNAMPYRHTAVRARTPKPLPIEPDLYWRFHHPAVPLDEAHASSRQWGTSSKDGMDRRGFSSFNHPHDLHRYLREMNWTGESGRDEVDFDERRIVGFRGRHVGRGIDGEDLAIPTSPRPEHDMSWGEFAKRLRVTTKDGAHWDMSLAHYGAKKLPKRQKCKYCQDQATQRVIHSEGMAYIPACDEHLRKAKDDAAHCLPDGGYDPSNINAVRKIAMAWFDHGGMTAEQAGLDQLGLWGQLAQAHHRMAEVVIPAEWANTPHYAGVHPYAQRDWYHGGTLDGGRTLYDKIDRSGHGVFHVGDKDAALDRIDPKKWDSTPGEFPHVPHSRLYRLRLAPGARVCPHIHDDDEDAGSLDFRLHDPDKYDVHAYRNKYEGKPGEVSLVGKSHVFRVEEDLGRHPNWQDPEVQREWHRLAKLPKTQTCKYCADPAVARVIHSEGMAYIPTCQQHLRRAKDDAARCIPDGSFDPSNVDAVRKIASATTDALDEVGRAEHPNVDHYRSGGLGHLEGDETRSVVGFVPTALMRRFREHAGDWNGEHSAEVRERLGRDIDEGKGFHTPLMIEYNPDLQWGYLGEGNHRLRVAEDKGLRTVPVRVVRSYGGVERRKAQGIGAPMHLHTDFGNPDDPHYVPSDIHPYHFLNDRKESVRRTAEHYSNALNMHDEQGTPVRISGTKPDRDWVEEYDDNLRDARVIGYEHHDDREVPLQSHAPVPIHSVSWGEHGSHELTHHHRFEQPITVHATRRTAGHSDYEFGFEHGLVGAPGNKPYFERQVAKHGEDRLDEDDRDYLRGHAAGTEEGARREAERAATGQHRCPECAGTGMGVWRSQSCPECHGSGAISPEQASATDTLYHLTDNPHFAPDPHKVPEDNALAINQRTRPGLFAAHDVEGWVNGHHYVRPYVAELHLPHAAHQPGRWGGERFIPAENLRQVKVHRIIPLAAHEAEQWQGQRYDGLDAREMTPAQHAFHKQRALDRMRDEHGFEPEDVEQLRRTWAARTARRVDDLFGVNDIDALFRGNPSTTVPFPPAGHRRDVRDYDPEIVLRALAHPEHHEIGEVDSRTLRSTQPMVTRAGVQHYLSGDYERTGETYADKDNLGNRRPVVYIRETEGRDPEPLLLSGHHRAVKALLRGEPLRGIVVRGPWGPPRG